jgi:hypothetical protein
MKAHTPCLTLVACLALLGCSDGNGGKPVGGSGGNAGNAPAPTGGSAGAAPTPAGGDPGAGGRATGGAGSSGSGGAGGAGSTLKTDGGAKEDARVENPDQAGAKGDSVPVPGTCAAFAPCGGDLLGTWHLKSECSEAAQVSSNCVMGPSLYEVSAYDLAYTFKGDGTFAYTASGESSQTLQYSAGCFGADAGATASCASLGEMLRQSLNGATDAGTFPVVVRKFECSTDSSGTCLCSDTFAYPHAISVGGTYTASASQVTTWISSASWLPDGGPPVATSGDPAEYCVSGNTLTIKMPVASGDLILVLTR